MRSFIQAVLFLAHKFALIECSTIEQLAQTAMEAPQDIIKLANRLISASINKVIYDALRALSSTITVAEALILFAIEMTLGTYACLALSAVNIGANEALNATEFVISEANRTVQSAAKDINVGLGKLSQLINGAIGLFNSVDDFVTGGDSEVQNINLTVAKLNNWSISPDINEKLESLRGRIPTYNGTMQKVESLIKTPLDEVKIMIMASNRSAQFSFIPNTSWTANSSQFPQCNVATVDKVFDDLKEAISKLTIILCVLCAFALLSGIALNLYMARSKYQRLLHAAETVTQPKNPFADDPKSEETLTVRDNMAIITYHLESSWLERYIQNFVPSQYWLAVQYSLSLPLAGFLMIGIAGFILSLMEIIVVDALSQGVHTLVELETGAVGNLTNIISRSYLEWQNQINSEIHQLENSVNDQVLGWIHHGSKNLNSTLSFFLDGINNETNATFHDTPLLEPLQAATTCLIGNKIKKVEKGLTWVYDNSQVTLPRVNDSLLSSISNSSSIAKGEQQASMVVSSAISTIRHEINTQLIVSGAFVALWLVFTIAALLSTNRHSLKSLAVKFPKSTFPKFAGWKMSESSIRRRKRPEPLKEVDISSPVRVRSPIERIADRVTRFFSGPSHQVDIDWSMSPKRATVLKPDTPKTPLRAMIFRNH